MSYPTLPSDALVRFVAQLRSIGGAPDLADALEFVGSSRVDREDGDADLSELADCAAELDARLDALGPDPGRAVELLEGEFCGPVHRALSKVPIEVLDDPAFWSYVSVRHFWRFVLVREHKSVRRLLGRPEPAEGEVERDLPLRRYFDGADVYQIPLRLFVRAQAVDDGDDYALAAAVVDGTDFWRSHVVRVSTSYFPPLSRALARAQATHPLNTTPLRAAARRINRYRANMHPVLLDDDDQDRIVAEFWSDS